MISDVALMVIAKRPQPGRVKTRLCPPLSADQAAEVASAALADTFAAMLATPATRRRAVFEGDPEGVVPLGFEVTPQVDGDLGRRLDAAFADIAGPALIVGMDTPQITPELLVTGAELLATADAVIGGATDGGFWVIGFREHVPGAFDGVPMSRPDTGEYQRKRLAELDLIVADLPELTDVDTADDLIPVAEVAPGTRFADTVHELIDLGAVS